MLDGLFANKNVQNILIFLFVNAKCYGCQLQKQFKTSLTPIQKALSRLEKAEVITSYYEGKTKVYQFNPSYPLLPELEALLKRAYLLLSAEEKCLYSGSTTSASQVLQTVWKRLKKVKGLTLYAKSSNRKGKGQVTVHEESRTSLIFYEKGSSQEDGQKALDFTNVYRWTLDERAKVISLEHLRQGIHRPVFLFHLAPDSAQSLASTAPHICTDDSYSGKLFVEAQGLRYTLRVIGPKKNDEIEVFYK